MKDSWKRNIILLVLVLFWTGPALAKIITVPSAKYTNIQQAVNAASNGDVVLLQTRVFTGPGNSNIDFQGKAITLKSRCGAKQSIIDLQGTPEGTAGFLFVSGENKSSVLSEVTIRNGSTGIICEYSSPTVTGCILQNNRSTFGSGILCDHSSPFINSCQIIENGSRDLPGGMYSSEGSPEVISCEFIQNVSRFEGGGAGLSGGTPHFENCMFTGNIGGLGGGISVGSAASILNCTFKGNSCRDSGGAIYCWGAASIVNCLIVQNSAPSYGAGVLIAGAAPTITNCTIADNSSGYPGSGISNFFAASPVITNCIIRGIEVLEVNDPAEDHPQISFSDIEGGYAGQGNIDSDPLLLNAPNGDYHLRPGSPCIDSGTNLAPQVPPVDRDYNLRIINRTVDMGCYEFGTVLGDLNGDRVVNCADGLIIYSALLKYEGQPGYIAAADYDHDGCITYHDYLQWWKYYLNYCGLVIK